MAPAARTKTLLAWSSGKDSAWTLHALRQDPAVEVVGLLTTVNQTFDRVAMHAVRTELLAAQAAAVGLPLDTVPIPYPCSNAEYEAAMGAAMERARRAGVQAVAFGDLFLEDVRRYREDRMRSTGLTPLFPIWGTPTGVLAHDMVAAGLRARLTCVDPAKLPPASPAATSTAGCSRSWPRCTRRSIPAASVASSIPSRTPDRCSRTRSRFAAARWWSVTGSSSRT